MADGTATIIEPETAAPQPAKGAKASKKVRPAKPSREQSSISFPYMDLDAGVAVASAILRGGGVPITRDQLAGLMDTTASSGTFLMKVASARVFGLVAFTQAKYELTNLGFAVLDSSDEKRQRSALAGAFLTVPLYKRVYEEFKGKQLPPRPHGLEQAFVKFGVSQKQKSSARQVFDRAARQAGFFPNGQDRLIEPIIGAASAGGGGRSASPSPAEGEDSGRPELPGKLRGLHPFIQGLLDTLPAAESTWTIEGRAKWLQAAAHCFDLIYKGDGVIQITAKAAPETTGERS